MFCIYLGSLGVGQRRKTFWNLYTYIHAFISEQTVITSAPYSLNWLGFITEMKSVYCAVRTESLNQAVCASCFKGKMRDIS